MDVATCNLVPIGKLRNVEELNRYYHFKHQKVITSLIRDINGNILTNKKSIKKEVENETCVEQQINNFLVLDDDNENREINIKNLQVKEEVEQIKKKPTLNKNIDIDQFQIPDKNINLFEGIDEYAYKLNDLDIPDITNRLSNINFKTNRYDFIIFSKTLIRLMEAPYVKQPWKLKVSKFGKTIYIYNESSENLTEEQKKYCYSTNKFKQMCKKNSLGNEFNLITSTKLNKHSIILCSRIDCKHSDGKYIQIKTTKELANEKLEKNFVKTKLIKYWLLSKLSNIDITLVAFRNNEGDIKGIATLRTNKMEDFIEKPYVWSSKICFNFADKVLNMLKNNVGDWDNYYLSYEYPYTEIKLTKC